MGDYGGPGMKGLKLPTVDSNFLKKQFVRKHFLFISHFYYKIL